MRHYLLWASKTGYSALLLGCLKDKGSKVPGRVSGPIKKLKQVDCDHCSCCELDGIGSQSRVLSLRAFLGNSLYFFEAQLEWLSDKTGLVLDPCGD